MDAMQTYTREAKPYIHALRIAEHLASRALKKQDGAIFDAHAALVYLAFSIESFCNHIGWKLSDNFHEFDKLSPKDKLKQASILAGCKIDLGSRPYQTFHDIFIFRNSMAHSKTEDVSVTRKIPIPSLDKPADLPPAPPTDWEKYCTPDILILCLNDVKTGLLRIYNASSLSKKCPFEHETSQLKMQWSIQPDKKEG